MTSSRHQLTLKVLFVKPPIRAGAFYFRIAQYIEILKKKGCEIFVLYPAPDGSTLLEKLPLSTILKKIFFLINQSGAFIRDFYASDLMIIFPTPFMSFYVALSKIFRKKIVIEHIVSYISNKDVFPKFPFWLDQYSYQSVNYIFTHTESMKLNLIERFKLAHHRIRVSYCSVDLNHFSPRYEKEVRELKTKYNLLDKFVVFYHGLHHSWHGFDLILEAAKIVEVQNQNIAFVFLPGNGYQTRWQGNVLHLTERDDYVWETLPQMIQMADLWISGFRNTERGDRSLGSTLIQAMALGRPILTSPSAEKDKFLKDHFNVFYIPPGSSQAIAVKILDLVRDQSQLADVGKNARETAENFFPYDILEQLFSGLI